MSRWTVVHYIINTLTPYIIILLIINSFLIGFTIIAKGETQFVSISTIVKVYSQEIKEPIVSLALSIKFPSEVDVAKVSVIPVTVLMTLISCGGEVVFSDSIEVIDKNTGTVIGILTLNGFKTGIRTCNGRIWDDLGRDYEEWSGVGELILLGNVTEVGNESVIKVEPILRFKIIKVVIPYQNTTKQLNLSELTLKYEDKTSPTYLILNTPTVVVTTATTLTTTVTRIDYVTVTKTRTRVSYVSTVGTKYVTATVTVPRTITRYFTVTVPVSKTVYTTVVSTLPITKTLTTSLVKTVYTATVTTSKIITLTKTKYAFVVAKLNDVLASPGGSLLISLIILAGTVAIVAYLRRGA